MPTQIYESNLDLRIGILETGEVSAGPSYPFPSLKATERQALRTFRTITLENPFLRLTIVPALGGRILNLFDKRTHRQILASDAEEAVQTLLPQPGGRRGAFLREGIQLRLDGEDRFTALGPVLCQIEEGVDDESPALAWLAESAVGNGLGFQFRITLPPDRAEVLLEARILNRTYRHLGYNGEIAVWFPKGDWDGRAVYCAERDAGFLLTSPSPFDGVRYEDGYVRFARFPRQQALAPRQVDTWTAILTPFSGLGRLDACSSEAGVGLHADRLRIQSAGRCAAHKVVLLTHDAQTFEAGADIYAEHVFEMSLVGLPSPPQALVLMDANRAEVLRFEANAPSEPRSFLKFEGASPNRPTEISVSDSPATLRRATFSVESRHLAHTLLGTLAMRSGQFADADCEFEQALLYNAEDPILWWQKALARRLRDASPSMETTALEEASELLNAHFLAPLEPALKAEALFSQGAAENPGPNPLLTAIAEVPEELVEVACMLIELGRFDLAGRWITEALRHADLAMLHLLLAYCLLSATHLDADAADQLLKAAAAGPPYPWRDIERIALASVLARFPNDPHLARLLEGMPST